MDIAKLKSTVEGFVSDNDMFLIDVKCGDGNLITVVVDSMTGVSLEKCIELNKLIESEFDREVEDYELTVASASISEPFKHIQQYYKNEGREVEVQYMNNNKQIGVLSNVTADNFSITYSAKVVQEGKKRKVLEEFKDTIAYEDARKVVLVIKF